MKSDLSQSFYFIVATDKVKDCETSTWKKSLSFNMIIKLFSISVCLKAQKIKLYSKKGGGGGGVSCKSDISSEKLAASTQW